MAGRTERSKTFRGQAKRGTCKRSICFRQKLLIPTFAAKQHGRNFASQRPVEISAMPIIITHREKDVNTQSFRRYRKESQKTASAQRLMPCWERLLPEPRFGTKKEQPVFPPAALIAMKRRKKLRLRLSQKDVSQAGAHCNLFVIIIRFYSFRVNTFS